jgi:hypothetical protein
LHLYSERRWSASHSSAYCKVVCTATNQAHLSSFIGPRRSRPHYHFVTMSSLTAQVLEINPPRAG